MTSTHQDRRQDEASRHPTVTEARQGVTTGGHVRWVMRISIALTIVALIVAFIVIKLAH